jgi:hypothetical protein
MWLISAFVSIALNNKISMKSHLSAATVTLLLSMFASVSGAQEWQSLSDKDGISVSVRDVPSSKVQAFKGKVALQAHFDDVVALLVNLDACTKWLFGCQSTELLEQVTFSERFIHQINKPPYFLVSVRDYIFHVTLKVEQQKKRARIKMISRHDKLPEGKPVRVKVASGQFEVTQEDGDTVVLIWQQHLEPGGALPISMVNKLMEDIPRESLQAFKALLKDPEYQGHKLVFDEHGEVVNIVR